MDKAITSAMLITISMIMVMMLFNVAYPAIIEGGDTIANMTGRSEARMSTQIEVVHAASEHGDPTGRTVGDERRAY